MKPIYLDSNASTPPNNEAKNIIIKNINNYSNPSSLHFFGRIQKSRLDDARLIIAKALGGKEKEVTFYSGASEANRFLVDSIILKSKKINKKLKIIITPFEHPSLYRPLENACKLNHITLKIFKIDQEKIILDEKLINEADIIFATQAHNETGIIINWDKIISHSKNATILISDASQGFARLNVLPKRIDAIVVSGHKMGAFPGIGGLLLRNNAKNLKPEWLGGEQEMGLRPGTEALLLIQAFAESSKIINLQRKKYQKMIKLRNYIEEEILKFWPKIKIIGKGEDRLPNTSAISINNVNSEALRIAIDQQKICVGFGSACSSLTPEPSKALIAMGMNKAEIKSTIRISFHCEINKNDIFTAIKRIKSISFLNN